MNAPAALGVPGIAEECAGERFNGQMAAQGAIGRMRIAGDRRVLSAQRCPVCRGWHIGTATKRAGVTT